MITIRVLEDKEGSLVTGSTTEAKDKEEEELEEGEGGDDILDQRTKNSVE